MNVTLSDDLHMQIVMLAAHDGVTPSQYVAAAIAEKIENTGGTSGYMALGRLRCVESVTRTLMIIPLPEMGMSMHDHLLPYCQA